MYVNDDYRYYNAYCAYMCYIRAFTDLFIDH